MPVPTLVVPGNRSSVPSPMAGLASLFAGGLILRSALSAPSPAAAGAWPSTVPMWDLFLVPAFALLGLAALLRVRRRGLRVPLGWAAAEELVGAVLVVGGATVLGLASPALRTERLAILAMALGTVCVGSAIVVTGVAYVTEPAEPTWVGVLLVWWPGLSAGWLALVINLGIGSVAAAALVPVGVALVLDGLQAGVRARRYRRRTRPSGRAAGRATLFATVRAPTDDGGRPGVARRRAPRQARVR